jgi:hypothetical protein
MVREYLLRHMKKYEKDLHPRFWEIEEQAVDLLPKVPRL